MVPRKRKYDAGEASNFMTRKRALKKLQLTLKVCWHLSLEKLYFYHPWLFHGSVLYDSLVVNTRQIIFHLP